jgi:hypothetical protein
VYNIGDVVHPSRFFFQVDFTVFVVRVGKKIFDEIANFLLLRFLVLRLCGEESSRGWD